MEEFFKLRAADKLMAFFDRKSAQLKGNTCSIELKIKTESWDQVLATIKNSPLCLKLNKLRLFENCYYSTNINYEILFSEYDLLNLNLERIDTKVEAPIRFSINRKTQSILYSWHHTLMDALGAEQLLATILLKKDLNDFRDRLFAKDKINPSFDSNTTKEKWLKTVENCSNLGLVTNLNYSELRLTPETSSKYTELAQKSGMQLFRSTFFLGKLIQIIGKNKNYENLVTLVPHNTRRKKDRPLIGNQVSFFAFSIKNTFAKNINEDLIEQAQNWISDGLLTNQHIFFDELFSLPEHLQEYLFGTPSNNNYASLYFSDIGNSSDVLDLEFIEDLKHFPPLFYPTALTCVVYRFRGEERVLFIHSKDQNISEIITELNNPS